MAKIILGLILLGIIVSIDPTKLSLTGLAILVGIAFAYGTSGSSAPLREIEHQIKDDPPIVRRVSSAWAWLLFIFVGYIVFLAVMSSGK